MGGRAAVGASPERYRGRPFLRLVDAYVLWAIGELPRSQQASLAALEGRLTETYGRSGRWYEIVAGVMGLPRGIDGAVRDGWRSYQAEVRAAGAQPEPLEFAHLFVDANWAPPPGQDAR